MAPPMDGRHSGRPFVARRSFFVARRSLLVARRSPLAARRSSLSERLELQRTSVRTLLADIVLAQRRALHGNAPGAQ